MGKTNTEQIKEILAVWKVSLPEKLIDFVAKAVDFSELSEAVNLLVTYQELFHEKVSYSDINRVKRILKDYIHE